jgi:menaquinone-dependent protoporphyrinogen oxidase
MYKMETLIIYASKHGCAEKCSKLLKERLLGGVVIVNIMKETIPDVTLFNSVIIGGSIYAGTVQKEIREFCSKNLDILKKKKIGLFICCMNKDSAEMQLNNAFPKELLDSAAAKGSFGGEFNFTKMNVIERFIVKMISKADKSLPAADGKKDISTISEESIKSFVQLMNKAS